MEYVKTISQKLYKFNPSGYCGFLLPEKTMKKLLKITIKHEEEVRKILTEDKDNLYLYGWGLAYPNRKQTSFTIAEPEWLRDKKQDRIDLFTAAKPEYQSEVFDATMCKNPDELKALEERIANRINALAEDAA